MKKLILGVILCLFSSIAFVYSIVTCYHFLYTLIFVPLGFIMFGGLIMLRRYTTNKNKRFWINTLLGVNLLFAIAAIGSLYYIYENEYGKVVQYITDKQTEKELGLLVAEYQQINHVTVENFDLHGDMHVAYQSRFAVFNDKSKVDVYPSLYNFIVSLRGDKVVDLFNWRNEKLDISEGYIDLTTIRNDDDGKPVYITGNRELVDSIKTLPDTVTFHIYNRQTKQDVDSLIFVKSKVFNNLSVKKESKEFSINRKQSLIERIKDLYLID